MSARAGPVPFMRRKTSIALLLAALIGLGLTVFLVTAIVDGDGSSESDGLRSKRGEFDPVRRSPPRGTDAVGRNQGGRRAPSILPGIADVTDSQSKREIQPTDPVWLDDLSRKALALMNAIMKEKDSGKILTMGRELQHTLRTLGHNVSPVVVDQLFVMLQEVEPPSLRRVAGAALGAVQGHKQIAERLLDVIQSKPKDPYTRVACYEALGHIQVQSIVPDLVASLGQGLPDERRIVDAIAKIGGTDANDALFAKLNEDIRFQTRAAIEKMLGQQKNSQILTEAAKALPDASPKARASLIRILGLSGSEEHSGAIRELLETETDSRVQKEAVEALGRIGDKGSAAYLLELAESDGKLSGVATSALGRLRKPESIEQVADAWDRLGDKSRRNIVAAIERNPRWTAKMDAVIEKALHDPNQRVRERAVYALGRKRREENVPKISKFVDRAKTNGEIYAGMKALERVGTKSAAEAGLAQLDRLSDDGQRRLWRSRLEKILDRAALLGNER